jgi:hypothetical protein
MVVDFYNRKNSPFTTSAHFQFLQGTSQAEKKDHGSLETASEIRL